MKTKFKKLIMSLEKIKNGNNLLCFKKLHCFFSERTKTSTVTVRTM